MHTPGSLWNNSTFSPGSNFSQPGGNHKHDEMYSWEPLILLLLLHSPNPRLRLRLRLRLRVRVRPEKLPHSCQHLLNHFSMHIREPALGAVVVKGQSLVIQAEQMEQGRVQVMNRADILDRLVTEFIRGAVAESALYTRPGQPDGETVRIVVAAARALLKGWHAAEFRHPHNERLVQQAAGFHIFDQRRARLIEDGRVHVVLLFKFLVAVPIPDAFTHRIG